MMRRSILIFATAAVALVGASSATGTPVYGTLVKANAAAAHEVYQTFFELNPKILKAGTITFHARCRRLTARTFRCDWTGENTAYYSAAGRVRVTFQPFGVDAVLAGGSICAPEGNVYETTGLNECP